jgi:uncharacterized protein
MKQVFLICLGLLSFVCTPEAQSDYEFSVFKNSYKPSAGLTNHPVYSFREMPSKNIEDYLLVFYKKYVSSQDVSQCPFEPSCSVFAVHAIHSKGWFIGLLAAFDRLSRDNAYKDEYYRENPVNGYLLDPFPF